jgi:hypothetical protein
VPAQATTSAEAPAAASSASAAPGGAGFATGSSAPGSATKAEEAEVHSAAEVIYCVQNQGIIAAVVSSPSSDGFKQNRK